MISQEYKGKKMTDTRLMALCLRWLEDQGTVFTAEEQALIDGVLELWKDRRVVCEHLRP